MKLKYLAAAAALVVSAGSQAVTVDWGTHDATEIEFGKIVTGGVPTGFTDIYQFEITPGFTLSNSVVVANNNPPNVFITGGIYQLLSFGGDGLFGTGDDSVLGSWGYNGTTGSTQNFVAGVGTGKYAYLVSGVATGKSAGVYTITSTVAAVPEPETYALLLAGLGVLGFVANRRKAR